MAAFQANVGGLTGQIRFSQGQRDDFELDVLRLAMDRSPEKIIQIGTWDPANKTKISDLWITANDVSKGKIRNITLIVTTKLVG